VRWQSKEAFDLNGEAVDLGALFFDLNLSPRIGSPNADTGQALAYAERVLDTCAPANGSRWRAVGETAGSADEGVQRAAGQPRDTQRAGLDAREQADEVAPWVELESEPAAHERRASLAIVALDALEEACDVVRSRPRLADQAPYE
jgi:hypothetical protein